jgi:hypothetical protein
VDNLLCWEYATQSSDVSADTWESPTLHGYARQRKLAVWAAHPAALEDHYILTSGTVDRGDSEDGDVMLDMTAWGYRLVASRTYKWRVHTGWYLWQRVLECPAVLA